MIVGSVHDAHPSPFTTHERRLREPQRCLPGRSCVKGRRTVKAEGRNELSRWARASRFTIQSTTRRQVVTRLLMVNRRQGECGKYGMGSGSLWGRARTPAPSFPSPPHSSHRPHICLSSWVELNDVSSRSAMGCGTVLSGDARAPPFQKDPSTPSMSLPSLGCT